MPLNVTKPMQYLTGEKTIGGYWRVLKINLLYLVSMIMFDIIGVV